MTAPINQTNIDNLEFARKALEIHGIILVSDFLRLKDDLFSDDGEMRCSLVGSVNPQGLPCLKLNVRGSLQLMCQRCLAGVEYPVDIELNYIVAPQDSIPAPEDEPEDQDYLDADTQMHVGSLIEDEILLALPLAPKHPLNGCGAVSNLNELKKPSPFAVLAKLKK